ncbi:hypothetical protein ONZ45_g9132 [Pleurotus djamor]|nr:hypothetical protein ONZ45_g9132 [Pleurotus djamor]
MSGFLTISALCIVSVFLVASKRWNHNRRNGLPLPPGPRKLPVIGNLLSAPTKYQWVKYAQWSKELGSDILHLQVLGTSMIVLNSVDSVQEILNHRSALTSGRSLSTMLNKLMGWEYNLALIANETPWRDRRRIFWQEFNPSKSPLHHPTQAKYLRLFLSMLLVLPFSSSNNPPSSSTPASSIIEVSYGISVEPKDDPMIAIADKAIAHLNDAGIPGTFVVDYVPILKYIPAWFPGASFKRFAQTACEDTRAMVENPYAAVKGEAAPPSFLSRVLSRNYEYLEDPARETMVKDVASAAYAKAQAEIDALLKGTRLPSFQDQASLPYSQAIMWETLRWKSVLPLGIAHRLTTDDVYSGYFLPRGSLVFANIWAILRDESTFPQPDEYRPERFICEDGTINRNLTEVVEMSFGFGRRICPGRYFARDTVWLWITSLLCVFNINPMKDEKGQKILPDTDLLPLFVTRIKSLQCDIKPRSLDAVSLITDSRMVYE